MSTRETLGTLSRVLILGLALVGTAVRADTQEQTCKLTASDGAAGNAFGTAVSVSGDRALIGASGSYGAYAAYVLERQANGTWTESAKLTASTVYAVSFGASVSVAGDRAVVGAPDYFATAISAGSAHVFERQASGAWIEVATLTPVYDMFRYFGRSVSIAGDIAVIGAPGEGGGPGVHPGSGHVFERQANGVWTRVQTSLVVDGASPNDRIGESVSVSGDVAVVGAPDSDDLGSSSGSVHVFTRQTSGRWWEVAKLTAEDGAAGAHFGSAVSVAGDYVVVGAPDDNGVDTRSGSAYVFERQVKGVWSQAAKLTAGDGAMDDRFGGSVSVSGSRAVVGASRDDDGGAESGSVYVFERQPSGEWVEVAKIAAADGAADDAFGGSVSVSGDVAMVGAQGDDDLGVDSGSAYVFEFHCTSYGSGCAGSGGFVPVLSAICGSATPGGPIAIHLTRAFGPSSALFVFGFSPASLAMGCGCTLNVKPLLPLILVVPVVGSGPGGGTATIASTLPLGASGYEFTMQAFVPDAGTTLGFSNTNGLRIDVP
jgi:hypothetical protein